MTKKIILASTSPRRKELLAKTGLKFEVVASDYEEDMAISLPPKELAVYLSKGKAESVALKYSQAIIIAADTLVVYQDQIIGKPHTAEKAKETLEMLNGRGHSVFTGFTIIDTSDHRSISQGVETKVYFKKLTSAAIDNYIASGEPLDKAGAYAIQGLGGELIEKIEGDYSNVVGLPMDKVSEALRTFGIETT